LGVPVVVIDKVGWVFPQLQRSEYVSQMIRLMLFTEDMPKTCLCSMNVFQRCTAFKLLTPKVH